MDDKHLTAEDVNAILAFVADEDPIIIGGQSISIWSQVYSGDNAELDAMAPLTSKDLDFLHNLEAERALEKGLKDGKLKIPSLDNMTPEAAIVTGFIGDRKVTVDFMTSVLGVDTKQAVNRSIKISDPDNEAVSLTLMHPLDCVRSRLTNINVLERLDDHSLNQAEASIIILDCYINRELNVGDDVGHKQATKAILEIEDIVRRTHTGKASQMIYGDRLDLVKVAEKYANDERIDARVRDKNIGPMIKRLRGLRRT